MAILNDPMYIYVYSDCILYCNLLPFQNLIHEHAQENHMTISRIPFEYAIFVSE